jgi:hypothetical protein
MLIMASQENRRWAVYESILPDERGKFLGPSIAVRVIKRICHEIVEWLYRIPITRLMVGYRPDEGAASSFSALPCTDSCALLA